MSEITKYKYVKCRAYGHAWDQIPTKRRPEWGTLLTFRCIRCTGIREDILNAYYDLSHRNYDMPEGYKTDKRTRSEWREELMRRNARMAKIAPEEVKTKKKHLVAV